MTQGPGLRSSFTPGPVWGKGVPEVESVDVSPSSRVPLKVPETPDVRPPRLCLPDKNTQY